MNNMIQKCKSINSYEKNNTCKPNIIFIMTDQHRFDCLGCTGNNILHTESINQLAQDGIIFNNAYCPSPICGPSRASVFSGIHAGKNGHYSNWVPFRPGITLLTDHLFHCGYFNAMVGKLHLHPTSARHGFDWKMLCDAPYDLYCKDEVKINPYIQYIANENFYGDKEKVIEMARQSEKLPLHDHRFWQGWSYLEDKYQMTSWTGNISVDFINNWNHRQPLFMHISFFGPHHPYATCEPWDSMYDPENIELPKTFDLPKEDPIFAEKRKTRDNMRKWDKSVWKKMTAQYFGNISAIDRQVGRIINALKQNNLYDNSIIVFTSDHGDHMGDYALLGKGDMYETSVKVPLIVKMPESSNRGKNLDYPVSSIDIFGTFLDAAGNKDWRNHSLIESGSLLKLITDNNNSECSKVFSIFACNPNCIISMLRQDNIKLIRAQSGLDVIYEGYDLNNVIKDYHNIFNVSSYQTIITEMQLQLDSWTQEQYKAHPLVNGYQPC